MNNLRNIRKRKGISLKQLHEMTGIPFRTLEDWDGEKRQIQSYHRVKMLAGALDSSMDDLMTKEEECLLNGEASFCILVQWEDGVHVTMADEDGFLIEEMKDIVMPREDALDLLKHIKEHKEVSNFLSKYIK